MIKSPEEERYLNDPMAQAKVKHAIPIACITDQPESW